MSNDKTRTELKGYFKKHAIPTEGQFADFIESTLNMADDGIGKQSDGTLTLQVTSIDDDKVLYLARKGEDPTWMLSLSQPGDGAVSDNGLGIGTLSADAVTPRLFIDEDTGHIGIGTTAPGDTLDVNGDIRVRGADIKDAGGTARISLTDNGNLELLDAGGTSRIRIADNSRLDLAQANGAAALSIDTAGRVGIGTTGPADTLDVNGNIRVRGADIKDAGGAPRIRLTDNGNLDLLDAGGTPRITIADNGRLDLKEDGGRIALSIDTSARVGIGITSPLDTLDVNGDIRVRGAEIKDAKGLPRIRLTDNGNLDLIAAGNSSRITMSDNGRLDLIQLGIMVLTIDTAGRVGIGTVSPDAKLEVTAQGNFAADAGQILLRDPSNNQRGLTLGFEQSLAGFRGFIQTMPETQAAGGSYLTPLLLQPNGGRVGIKTSSPSYDLHTDGTSFAKKRLGGGIDYAEYFESLNGKTVRAGTSVVLDRGKIRRAKNSDIPIGVISANPVITGGAHAEWPKRYLSDEFGILIMEAYREEVLVPKKERIKRERHKTKKKTLEEEIRRTEIVLENNKYCQKEISETVTREIEEPVFEEVDLYDAEGETVISRHQAPVMETFEEEVEIMDEQGEPVLVGSGKFVMEQRPKINPDYDESKEYVGRESRPEWNCVGLLGQLSLRKGQPVAPTWIKIKDVSDEVELWLVK